jgi:hypothetical protein
VHDERQRCVTFECLHRTALVLVVLGAESCHSPHLSSSDCDCAAAPIAVAALRLAAPRPQLLHGRFR